MLKICFDLLRVLSLVYFKVCFIKTQTEREILVVSETKEWPINFAAPNKKVNVYLL